MRLVITVLLMRIFQFHSWLTYSEVRSKNVFLHPERKDCNTIKFQPQIGYENSKLSLQTL